MKRAVLLAMVVIMSTLLLSACGSSSSTSDNGKSILEVKGAVAKPQSFSEAALKALGETTVNAELKGEKKDYKGVLLSAILAKVQVNADAKELVLRSGDNFEATVTIDEAKNCKDCLIAFDDDGSIRAVMPGLSTKAWVKQLAQLELR